MTDKDFEFITDKIGIWFANLKLKSFRHTFDGDIYPSSALVTDYELFIAKLKKDIEFIPEEPEFTIDKDVSQMADEFAEREYEFDGYERKWLSKGYYHGYMDANKSKPEEPVSEDLIQASEEYISPWQVYAEDTDGELLLTNEPCERAFIAGAQWDREKTIDKVVEWLKENVHKYADSFVDSFELCKDLKQIF